MSNQRLFISIGECMVEMAPQDDGAFRMGFAGDTLNTAWYARRGLPDNWDVSFFTDLGQDSASKDMMRFLNEAGIGTSFIRCHSDRRPGLYLIGEKDGDRVFTYWRDSSAARRLADDGARLSAALGRADAVFLSGITLAILSSTARSRLFSALSKIRAPILFDPNVRPVLWENPATCRDAVMQAAALSHTVLPSFDDDAALFGDATPKVTVDRYRKSGATEIVVKNGTGNTLVAHGKDVFSFAVPAAGRVVDTTGAGDAFNGCYIAARLCGRSVLQAIEDAQATAAKVVCHQGALMH
ncbi:MAG: sugar kinase [Marinosulfonomonas sp.]|nr:sugar kinase [Marinosulfonomonas sp.]